MRRLHLKRTVLSTGAQAVLDGYQTPVGYRSKEDLIRHGSSTVLVCVVHGSEAYNIISNSTCLEVSVASTRYLIRYSTMKAGPTY
jgi:hypothetical protein